MNSKQIAACLRLDHETLDEANAILTRIQNEPYPQRAYHKERLESAQRLVNDIHQAIQRLNQQYLAALEDEKSAKNRKKFEKSLQVIK